MSSFPRYDRSLRHKIVGAIFLGLAINQFIVFTGNRSLRAAEAAESKAEAAWSAAKPLAEAVKRSRAHALYVADSLGALVVSAEARADEAAYRASEAIVVSDSLTIEIGEGRHEFRDALVDLLPGMVPMFDIVIGMEDLRKEQLDIALSEKGAQVVSLEQALRTSTRIVEGLRAQITRDAMAQASLEEAIALSQAEADSWKSAANPGFILGLWKDLPKLVVVGGAAYLYGRSGG